MSKGAAGDVLSSGLELFHYIEDIKKYYDIKNDVFVNIFNYTQKDILLNLIDIVNPSNKNKLINKCKLMDGYIPSSFKSLLTSEKIPGVVNLIWDHVDMGFELVYFNNDKILSINSAYNKLTLIDNKNIETTIDFNHSNKKNTNLFIFFASDPCVRISETYG